MARITLHLPVSLRAVTEGASELTVDIDEGGNIGSVLAAAEARHPGLAERIADDEGRLRPFVSLFLDDTDIRSRDGLETPVRDGAVVYVVQAVAGGSLAQCVNLSFAGPAASSPAPPGPGRRRRRSPRR